MMIKIENTEVVGWGHAIRGMRNPMNSWEKSDTRWYPNPEANTIAVNNNMDGCKYAIGPNDASLMMRLAKGGPVHAKYRRMIVVYADIIAPLYWWKEFDTYKVGTVANSCSTMHKIHAKEFTRGDFSIEHLESFTEKAMDQVIGILNAFRELYLDNHDKKWWWQMIQLLPSSYNQRRTVMLNYEVLCNIYHSRKDHKLDEWRDFCKWIESIPYFELIIGGNPNEAVHGDNS